MSVMPVNHCKTRIRCFTGYSCKLTKDYQDDIMG